MLNDSMRVALESKMNKVLTSGFRVTYSEAGDLSISLSLIKIRKMSAYIYGAGKNVWQFVRYLLNEGIEVCGIVDRIPDKYPGGVFGTPVISIDAFVQECNTNKNCFCFIYANILGMSEIHIMDILKNAGVTYFYNIDEYRKKRVACVNNSWIEDNRGEFYAKNKTGIINTLRLLEDAKSIETLIEYIRAYIECDYYRLQQIDTKYKYFCDDRGEEIYTQLSDEVWMNFGAYDGDTIFKYFQEGLKCSKIIAVEGDRGNYNKLCDNVSLLPQEYRKKVKLVNEFIDAKTDIKAVVGEDKLTLINADIEGYELDMLHVFANRIIKDRPVIAICLYHKREDIIEIPKYIDSLAANYHFILRKYKTYFGDQKGVYELVLYAVPEERMPSSSMTQS